MNTDTTTPTRKPRAKRKVQIAAPATTTHPFRDVMRAGVPLVQYETSDPAATIKTICKAMNDELETRPVLEWDCLRSVRSLNEPGKAVASLICGQDPQSVANPVALLAKLDECASNRSLRLAVIFMHNAHRFTDDVAVMQGTWNLRDRFKAIGASLVLLCPNGKVPLELKQDVVTLSDPLPDSAELQSIVKRIAGDAVKAGATFDPDEVSTDGITIDTLLGLSPFGAEQVTAMSVRKDRLDSETLWERKKRMIEQTPGLAVWQGGETFDELGGLSNLKQFLTAVLTSGKTPVRGILYADEIEKSLAGAQGDTSGTSQDQLGVILRCMQDWELPGMILCGHPGTGKSAISKAAGNIAGAPVIALDLGAMKGSLVGESEGRIRAAMEIFRSVCQGKGLVIATCNRLNSLPPELRRRFSLGIFMVEMPQADERAQIWKLWLKRYNLPADSKQPDSDGWTGSEIKACCDVANRTGLSLIEAGKYIVPVSKSSPEQVEALRRMASGKFISASRPGIYEYSETQQTATEDGRKIQLH